MKTLLAILLLMPVAVSAKLNFGLQGGLAGNTAPIANTADGIKGHIGFGCRAFANYELKGWQFGASVESLPIAFNVNYTRLKFQNQYSTGVHNAINTSENVGKGVYHVASPAIAIKANADKLFHLSKVIFSIGISAGYYTAQEGSGYLAGINVGLNVPVATKVSVYWRNEFDYCHADLKTGYYLLWLPSSMIGITIRP
ncbi:MAG: hypothetical protein JST70_01370 [Bacteroidetes bacterium]|nr:hypothetical protein [Bacteroidota bacterium]